LAHDPRGSGTSTHNGNRLKAIRVPDRSYDLVTIGRLAERISCHGHTLKEMT
jgi:hypothetical protein